NLCANESAVARPDAKPAPTFAGRAAHESGREYLLRESTGKSPDRERKYGCEEFDGLPPRGGFTQRFSVQSSRNRHCRDRLLKATLPEPVAPARPARSPSARCARRAGSGTPCRHG